MKILNDSEYAYILIETDDEDAPFWRRTGTDSYSSWEHSVCGNWENCSYIDNQMIENMYREYLANSLPRQTKEEKEFIIEEYEAARFYLDSLNVASEKDSKHLSLVGRIADLSDLAMKTVLLKELSIYRAMFHKIRSLEGKHEIMESLHMICDWSDAHKVTDDNLFPKESVKKQIQRMTDWLNNYFEYYE